MLNPEIAKARLKEFAVPDSQERLKTRLSALPDPLHEISSLLLIPDEKPDYEKYANWSSYYHLQQQARYQAMNELPALPDAERQQLIQACFPTMAVAVERGWQLFARLPYQLGYTCKAFRSSHMPSHTVTARANWLIALYKLTSSYETQNLVWFAEWAAYLGYQSDELGILFAAAIDGGEVDGGLFETPPKVDSSVGDEIFEILCGSARGEQEIGAFGRHVCRALLVASRPEGWELMEKMLLTAQRQEGLRQVILETIDEAHPDAFRRMLRIILDNDLCRFSAVIRAVNVWFGFGYEAMNNRAANTTLAQTLTFLEDPHALEEALQHGDPHTIYLALWALATRNADAAIEPAVKLLNDADAARRFAAAHFLAQLELDSARRALVPALEDTDKLVAWRAFSGVTYTSYGRSSLPDLLPDLFERFERFAERFGAKEVRKAKNEADSVPSPVWPWLTLVTSAEAIGQSLIVTLGTRSPRRLLPYMPLMDGYRRVMVVDLLLKSNAARHNAKSADENSNTENNEVEDVNSVAQFADRDNMVLDADIRELLFQFVQDKDSQVCEKALATLKKIQVTPEEAQSVEPLLKRTGSDIRRGVQALLLTQTDDNAFASMQRMIAAGNAPQRSAGLEIMAQMLKSKRAVDPCLTAARAFQASIVRKTEADARLLQTLLDTERKEASLVDGLGLYDPTQRTIAPPPQSRKVVFITSAAIACLKSLDEIIEQNRELPLQVTRYGTAEEMLLGDITFEFPKPVTPNTLQSVLMPPADSSDQASITPPLNDLWETWYASRPDTQRDADGMELLRALSVQSYTSQGSYFRNYQDNDNIPEWDNEVQAALFTEARKLELKHHNVVNAVIQWLLEAHTPPNAVDFLLDAVETSLARIPPEKVESMPAQGRLIWRGNPLLTTWIEQTRIFRARHPRMWTDAQHIRFCRLLKWLDQPTKTNETSEGFALIRLEKLPRLRPSLLDTLLAYRAGAANETDLLDCLIGVQNESHSKYTSNGYDLAVDLDMLTGRKLPEWMDLFPTLPALIARIRARIVDVELERTEEATAATQPAFALRWSGGTNTLIRMLMRLNNDTFARLGTGSRDSRINTFSHLVRASYPEKSDTAAEFARIMKEAKIGVTRLIELAMFAPQWASFVEQALGWPQLAEAVWWIHAHTKDQQWSVPQEMRDEWTAQSAERTPLTAQSLLEGAVDVAWFHRVYNALGAEKWKALDEAAKYASTTGGHKRAQLFADAMLGRLDKKDLLLRIKDKRNQDGLRALGLLPLPAGKAGEADTLERYKLMQEFIRTSRQFGAQRQQSEKMTANTAMENLARTAGFTDPARLEWAMEASAVADLAKGPVSVEADGTTFTLSINALGKPEFAITKNGKALKAVPASLRKEPAVLELQERKRDIDRQASRMRLSLEQAMCRGDRFTASELPNLMAHPVLAPMLRSIVFLTEKNIEKNEEKQFGYPLPFGRALQSVEGEEIPLHDTMTLRIAHPYDLLHTGHWELWQRDCFLRERIQPFKQVYRELYVLTESESDQNSISRRYDGQQLNPRQAMALLGSRGWVSSYEEGPRRTFHDVNLTACLGFDGGYTTPAEVEGLTVAGVYFTKRGEWKPLPLTQIPPRVFSEAMRDLDLVVSVAHQGGVDPEASASTVEMRANLVRESLRLLKIENVRLQSSHALIDGKLGTYSVHLGSAIVHRQPGGALCIIPVHGQHRGRLFLPFADDDPRSAEVVSKVILLANDTQIKDPIILEQILVAR